MSGQDIIIEQLREELEKAHAASEYQTRRIEHYRTQLDFCERRAEKSERERDAAVAAIAASERRAAEADVHLSDAESRRRTAGSNAIEWESRAKNAERALAAAGESADAIRAMLGGADDLVIAVRCLADRAEKAEEDRDALRHHYDKAGPEHNLLALLDMYDEWRAAAESERDEERHLADVRGEMLTKTERERDEAREALRVARTDRDREAHDRQTTSDAWNDMRRQRDAALVERNAAIEQAKHVGACLVECSARAEKAERERDEARAERDARPDIATLPTEYVCGEWIMSGQAEPDAVVTYAREPGPETGHVGWCWWARGKMGESRDYMAARDAAEHSLIAHAAKVKP